MNTELEVIFVLSRAWIDEAESLKKIIYLSVVSSPVRVMRRNVTAIMYQIMTSVVYKLY